MPDAAGSFPIGAQLDPQSVAAAGSATGSYVNANVAPNFVAFANVGAGAGSCAFSIVQAKDASGTGVKALGTLGVTIAVAQTSGSFDVPTGGLDLANGFYFIALKVAVTGGAGTLAGGVLAGCSPRYAS